MTPGALDFDPEKYLRLKTSIPLFEGKELPLAEIIEREGKPIMAMRRFRLNQETLEPEEVKPREHELNIDVLKAEKAKLEDNLSALSQIIFEVESL
ncbi:unnamed protein product [marine sediment metagenome]|uniref:Uncharacterized protein n=1 Tax=marine sediment metagenome TaxID=412755 RepID=X0TSX7_9ZZZZ